MWQESDDGEFAHVGTMEDLNPQDVFYHPPITNEDELALWMAVAEVQVWENFGSGAHRTRVPHRGGQFMRNG